MRWLVTGASGSLGAYLLHELAMSEEAADCAWVHAYLHRVEGDLENAGYWYRQARRKPAAHDLGLEWSEIAAALLDVERS